MSNIASNVGTVVGDVTRPQQSKQDRRLQAEVAQASEQQAPEDAVVSKDVAADDLQGVVEQLSKVVEVASGRQLDFGVDDSTDQLLVEVRERASGEVVKQIPAEEVVDLAERMDQLIGLFLDVSA